MMKSKLLLALAGLTLAAQVVSVDAEAQTSSRTREKCRTRSSRTVGGAGIGAILGGVVGAIAGDGRGAAIGAGVGAAGGAVIRDAEGADACREVRMDREDREEARRDREEDRRDREEARRGGGYGRGDRDTFVLPKYTFEQDFLKYYARNYSDEQRLNEVAEYSDVLRNRNEMIDGEALYQILVRIDGGRDQRLTANRAEALRMIAPQVAGLNYDQRSWVEGLFPNKGHRLYPEVARTIRMLSY